MLALMNHGKVAQNLGGSQVRQHVQQQLLCLSQSARVRNCVFGVRGEMEAHRRKGPYLSISGSAALILIRHLQGAEVTGVRCRRAVGPQEFHD